MTSSASTRIFLPEASVVTTDGQEVPGIPGELTNEDYVKAYLDDSSYYTWEEALEEAESRDRRAAYSLKMSVLHD